MERVQNCILVKGSLAAGFQATCGKDSEMLLRRFSAVGSCTGTGSIQIGWNGRFSRSPGREASKHSPAYQFRV